jgi:hypothetical protein
MKNTLILLLIISSQYCSAQCDITFTISNYNGFGISCYNACDGEISVVPTGVAPFTYNWSSGETTQNITGLCSSNYILTLTDDNGCSAVENVFISQPSELIASVNIANPISEIGDCDGELNASATGGFPGYSYEWIDCTGQYPWLFGGVTFCAGEWGSIVTDINGCIDTACVTLNWPVGDTCTYISENYYLGGLDCAWLAIPSYTVDSYQWVNCDSLYAPFPGDTIQGYSSNYIGNVAVILSAYGCIDTSYCHQVCVWGIEEVPQVKKELIKIVDLTGRETDDKSNTLLIYIYSDGTMEKVFRVE